MGLRYLALVLVFICNSSVSIAQNPKIVPIDSLLEALFDDPTNLEKNYELLAEQTRQGDLLGASATLERILILDPDSKLARVLLSEVQFNLGNLTMAKLILTSLQSDNSTPPEMLQRVDDILVSIDAVQSVWDVSGVVTVNRGSAKNPRGASSSDTILLTDIEVTNETLDRSEAFIDSIVSGKVNYTLPTQALRALEATAVVYHRDYMFYDAGDLTSLQASIEYQQKFEPQLIAGAKVSGLTLAGESYSTSSSAYGQINSNIFNNFSLTAFAETTYNNNFNTEARSAGRDYNGEKNTATLSGLTQILSYQVQLSGSYSRSDPKADIYKNTSRSVSLSTSIPIEASVLNLRAEREWLHYRTADILVSTKKREDVSSSTSAILTTPFSNSPVENTNITAKASYTSVESSIANFDKDSAEFHLGISVGIN